MKTHKHNKYKHNKHKHNKHKLNKHNKHNRYFCNLLVLPLIAMMLTACDGIFAGIYDQPIDDSQLQPGLQPVAGQANRYTLLLDARDYEVWHYIDLSTRTIASMPIPNALSGAWDGRSGWTYNEVAGDRYTQLSTRKTDPQPQPQQWDMAIHHFDIRTNGGSAMITNYNSIDALLSANPTFDADDFVSDIWSTTHVITDLEGMMAYRIGYQNTYVNEVLSSMVTMDFSSPPPTYHHSDAVIVMRLSDGTYAAMQMLSYMSQNGTKGFLTMDIAWPLKKP